MTATVSPQWSPVCKVTDLDPERGAVALVHGRQVALFRTHDDEVYAIGHRDPFSGAYVLARGIVGSRTAAGGEVPTVASPMYKQVFDLRTGRCLDEERVAVPSYPVRIVDGMVEVGTPRGKTETATPRGKTDLAPANGARSRVR